ncbi:hypothetical protein [Parvularcula marina]|uniref:hypothetical protein n=1 Tax=Parvularcula marina TaxID=2292771 RepID=UPI00351814BD
MTKHYTELTGALGDKIQFGPPMHSAEDFFNKAVPVVSINGVTYELRSIGTLGFTLVGPLPEVVNEDDDPLTAVFTQSGREIFETRILKPTPIDDQVINCRCFDRAITLEKLGHANAAAVAAARVRAPKIAPMDIPTEYKVFCADTLDIMATLRRQVEEEISPFEQELTAEERHELDKQMEEAVADQWLPFLERANSLVLPFKHDIEMRTRMKRYTENVVTGEMCKGALQHRCYYKPLGYPGDFEIMNAFYDNVPRGENAYNRLVDMLGLIAGRPVAKRMHYLTAELERMVATSDRRHHHVMSVGAGPAREFKRFFERAGKIDNGFSITLVDPETRALECAIGNIYSSVKHGVSSIMVSGMNTSFTEMLRPKSTFRHLPPQDFIYSAGLTDYLNTKLTKSMVSKLYDLVRPGGTVLIGNVNDAPNGMYWSAEYAVDWSMFFRNMAEMEEIADGLPGNPEITADESGSYFMLKLTKPA